MSTILFIVFLLLTVYAAISVITAVVDLKTGRYKRLKRLQQNMDDARTQFESRRKTSDKFWESV